MKHETAINQMLGNALKKANQEWDNSNVKIEETQMLAEYPSKRPDIIINTTDGLPVIIETSFNKRDAENDAKGRLGMTYKENMQEIKTTLAVYLDQKYKKISKLTSNNLFHYALYQKLPDGTYRRFPKSDFIIGNFKEMALLVESTYITKEDMEEAAKHVSDLVKASAKKLKSPILDKKLVKISEILYQRSTIEGLETTTLLWLNAL